MQTATITAQDQFIRDYLLVVENDYSAYRTIQEWISECEGNAYVLGCQLQESFEDSVDENTAGITDETARDLFRQLLLGWGIDTFTNIARHLIDRAGE
jgi:hypothetical protein